MQGLRQPKHLYSGWTTRRSPDQSRVQAYLTDRSLRAPSFSLFRCAERTSIALPCVNDRQIFTASGNFHSTLKAGEALVSTEPQHGSTRWAPDDALDRGLWAGGGAKTPARLRSDP